MIKRVSAVLAMLCPLTLATPVFADVPSLLPIQGYLTDKQNVAIDGSRNVSFRLYSTATGGTALHEEMLPLVIAKGYFTAYLGDDSTNPLDFKPLRDSPRVFLGIEVGTDGEAVPRLQLASTAFAVQAIYCSDSNNLGGKAPTAFAAAMHTHDWSEITGKPTTFPPTPTDPMCYANLTAAGYLDGNSADDLTTQAQGDARYAAKAHTHDAGDIQSGTLNDARYSAYADLGVEGYLDANTGTDLVTFTQGDARYMSASAAVSVNSSMIVDGTIVAADLAANSVTMDKTSAPIGMTYSSMTFSSAGGQYIFGGASLPMDSAGTCLFTATARSTSGTLANSFFVYPAVETTSSSGTTQILCSSTTSVPPTQCAGSYSYGMLASGSTNIYSTSATPGSHVVTAGNSYRFGCYISAGTASTYYCIVSWVCN